MFETCLDANEESERDQQIARLNDHRTNVIFAGVFSMKGTIRILTLLPLITEQINL